MSHTTTAADRAASERPNLDRIETLTRELRELHDVAGVVYHGERTPARATVTLTAANVTTPVADLLNEYEANVENDSLTVTADGALSFDVTTPEGFKNADSMTIRTHGTSIVVTLTREALDLSGFGEGTKVNEQARDGAILLTSHED